MADDRSLPFGKRAYENYRSEVKNVGGVAVLIEKRELGEIEEYRKPLSIDEEREITIVLSFGGPSDGYKIVFDRKAYAVASGAINIWVGNRARTAPSHRMWPKPELEG